MLWLLFIIIFKLEFVLKSHLIFHTLWRCIIFIEIHISTFVFIVSIAFQIRCVITVIIRVIIQLLGWLLVIHLRCISSLVAISLIFLLLFVLLVEVIHNVIVVSIGLFQDTLNHTLSVGVLHGLFGVGLSHLVWVVAVAVAVWFVGLVSSARTSTLSGLIAAYLVLLFEWNSVLSMRRLSECKWLRISLIFLRRLLLTVITFSNFLFGFSILFNLFT